MDDATTRRRNRRLGLILLLIALIGLMTAPVLFRNHWWHSIGTIAQSK
jgi:hypothetical protein